MHGQQNIKT